MSSELRVDWCSYQAARAAVKRWHYLGTMPRSKNVYLGVWEDGRFRGVVVVGMGSGNSTNGKAYGLAKSFDLAEVERICLAPHHKVAVSRVLAIASKMVKRQSPGLRGLVSYADPSFGHHGGIYQAAGWIYVGQTPPSSLYHDASGTHHQRCISKTGLKKQFKRYVRVVKIGTLTEVKTPGKHKYLHPFDDELKERLLELAQPYPKRPKDSSEPLG